MSRGNLIAALSAVAALASTVSACTHTAPTASPTPITAEHLYQSLTSRPFPSNELPAYLTLETLTPQTPSAIWGQGTIGQVAINFRGDLAPPASSRPDLPPALTLTVYDTRANALTAYHAMYTSSLGYTPPATDSTLAITLTPANAEAFCLRQLYGAIACGWVYDGVVAFASSVYAHTYGQGATNSVLQAGLDDVTSIDSGN